MTEFLQGLDHFEQIVLGLGILVVPIGVGICIQEAIAWIKGIPKRRQERISAAYQKKVHDTPLL